MSGSTSKFFDAHGKTERTLTSVVATVYVHDKHQPKWEYKQERK